MTIDLSYMLDVLPSILSYLPVTLELALFSMVIGVVLGLFLALVRFTKVPVLNHIAAVYISLFRGMPTLVQLFLIYYGLPQLFPELTKLDALTAAIIGFGLKEASYLAEIFRASLNSVDRGQYEAGLAVGLTGSQIYRRFIIPQAAYNALPATGNVFVSLLKETSVAFTLGLTEIFAEGKLQASASFRFFETYLVVGLVYWGLVIIYSWLQSRLERRLAKPYMR